MNFETEYKKIRFQITLESIAVVDVSLLLGDKFNRLPHQTVTELKKGTLLPYNLIVKSYFQEGERTHYWSNVLLTNKEEDLIEELGHYLDDEDILDLIAANWELGGDESGPAWKLTLT